MRNLIRKLQQAIQSKRNQQKIMPASTSFDITHLKKMLTGLTKTLETECSCDEVFELLDQYAEMAVAQGDAAQVMPLVDHHLRMCPDCREEYDMLMQILSAGKA